MDITSVRDFFGAVSATWDASLASNTFESATARAFAADSAFSRLFSDVKGVLGRSCDSVESSGLDSSCEESSELEVCAGFAARITVP